MGRGEAIGAPALLHLQHISDGRRESADGGIEYVNCVTRFPAFARDAPRAASALERMPRAGLS
jgi:hypothetical protein